MSNKRANSGRRAKGSASQGPDREGKLRLRLKVAEETLAAIQSGEVDAVMVKGRRGKLVVALKGGEPAYRMLVEAMSEGAATLSSDGAILYSNRRFAELIRRSPGKMAGISVPSLLEGTERARFAAVLAAARKGIGKGEFNLRLRDGNLVPVHLSLNRLPEYGGHALGLVVTDLSEHKRNQASEIKQAETTHRLLLTRALSAQEEERRRISRELHDEAGQLLTSLLVGLRTLEDSRNIADAKAHGQRLREITAQAIDEIGRLARGLHPTVLDDHGLGVAISRYVSEYAKTYKIAVDLRPKEFDTSDLSPAVQMGVYRILQEALTNVARHSGAKAVGIRFTRSATALLAEVTDNGRGFDTKGVAASSSRLGIQSMRERAAMLGGTVTFTSRRPGTRILVQIPLTDHPNVQPLARRRKI